MRFENKLYNPADQSKEFLIENFVVRTKVFEKLFKDVRNGKMKYPEQNYIIQGQRGMGKTTLLLRLKYEIENTPELNTWLIPVFFNEETYDVTSLANLWEKLLKHLDKLWNTGGALYNKTEEFAGKDDYEKKCFDFLIQTLRAEKKKLLLLYDNFGELFLDILSEKETHRLREILTQYADIRIIAASAVVIQDTHDYSKPFFEFFKIIYLEGLNKEETYQLIAKLQERSGSNIDLEKSKAKIEALAILTGGVIRTVMLIYEAILSDKDGSALQDLETILDRVTPLYKHRIEVLPVQQRKIFDVIAKKWDAISTKEIGESIREDGKPLQSKLISAQLQQLEKNNFIEKKETNTKNNLYQLKERFFNIWYLMRSGDRNDKCRVVWYTKYLEFFYADEGLKTFINAHIKKLRSGTYNSEAALFVANAVVNSNRVDWQVKDLILNETRRILNESQKGRLPRSESEIIEKVFNLIQNNKVDDALIELKSISDTNLLKAVALTMLHKYDDAIKVLKPLSNPNTDSYSNYFLGMSYYFQQNDDQAIIYLSKPTLDYKSNADKILGDIYVRNHKFDKAVQYYEQFKKSIESGQNYVDVALNLGTAYLMMGEVENSKKYLLIAAKDEIYGPEAQRMLGLIYFEDGEWLLAEESLNNFLKSIDVKMHGSQSAMLAKVVISYSYYQRRVNKEKAYSYIKDLDIHSEEFNPFLIYAVMVYLWNDDFLLAFSALNECFKIKTMQDDVYVRYLGFAFMLAIAKKQYHSTLKYFERENLQLKDRLKPIYYALMHYLKNEYPNEIIKMGAELVEPVRDVMKKVEEMTKDYA